MHTADTLTSTPQSEWIESEVPSLSMRRAKSAYSAICDENEIAPSVPKSAKKRNKSVIATPKKEVKSTIDIEMSDATTTILKSAKLSPAQGSTEVVPMERNVIDAPKSTKIRGKSLAATPKKAPSTPKAAEKRSHSLAAALYSSNLRKSGAIVS